MQSQSAQILILETARQARRRDSGTADILRLPPRPRELPAWHPVTCVVAFLAVTLGAWSLFFWMVGWL